jgi:ATP-dependent RNA helicase DbpA
MKIPQFVSDALQKLNIASLNSMQEAAFEAATSHNQVVLLAPTGSGKTLGFLLPLLEQLDPQKDGVQALVITPTRELALQIEQVFRGMGTDFKVNTTYGGHSMKIERNNFSEPPALLIGTPGRITDHLNRGNIDLSGVRTLILDEFDKCLEMGFQEDMTHARFSNKSGNNSDLYRNFSSADGQFPCRKKQPFVATKSHFAGY